MNIRLHQRLAILALASAVLTAQTREDRAYRAAKIGGNYMQNYYLPQAASTPHRPAFSPDGREIAFAMAGSIWKIGVGDGVAYQLTANRTYDSDPAWSPDGKSIVYTADDDGRSINLMLLDVRTGESSAITHGDQINLDPAWAPDGKRLAYVSTAPNGWFQIFAAPIDNGQSGTPQQITADHRFGRARLYFHDYDHHIQPTWSPDGKELICISNRGIPLGSGAIWRMPVAPDAMSTARMILREETLFRTRPQWSGDGKRILYSSHRGAQFTNLYVLPVEGGEPYQLTFGEWDHFEPRWSPDGEWIVYISNRRGLSELRLLKTFGGADRPIEIRQRIYRQAMGFLDLVVKDAATGQRTPARVYMKAADGKTYAPRDAFHRVGSRLGEHFFHTAGQSQIEAPPGKLEIEVTKGFQYQPQSKTIDLPSGNATITVEIALQRSANLQAQGWYSGSNHVHMNYGGNLLNTPENLLLMAAAEDMDIVDDKICNKDNRIFDHQFFTGALDRRSLPDRLLYFNEEYRPPFWGHVSYVNLKRHLISPFTTGYEGTAIESLYPTNADMFRLARAEGAIGGYVHPWSGPLEKSGYAVARGFPVDLALGVTEYLEVLTSSLHGRYTGEVWHRALNCGFRVTATGGEDSILSLHRTPVIGADRTYAYLGSKLDYNAWVEALRAGRTFVTNGPLLEFRVNGKLPGDEIKMPVDGGSLEVSGKVTSVVPVEKLELIYNGTVVEASATGAINKTIAITRSGWYTLRATGSQPRRPTDDQSVFAETSPIYVLCGDRPIRSRQDAQYFVRWIDDVAAQADRHPGWRSDSERKHVSDQFAEARKVFEQRAAEAGR